MAYNTGNALGSSDVRDLKDNTVNLDWYANGPAASYVNRFGQPRKSVAQMNAEFLANEVARANTFIASQNAKQAEFNEFLENSGYETPVDYVAGLGITRLTQVLRFGGELYRAKDAILPFTTTTWAADAAKLFAVGDAVLRQELADPTNPAKGLYKVGTAQFGLGIPSKAAPAEKGFWSDIGAGVNMWRFRDRLMLGDAVDQDGNKFPTVKSWVGFEAGGFMTYFDSRTQMGVFSTKGGVGAAFASRSSDNLEPGELNTIGAGSYVTNDNLNAADKKAAWSYYGHAVQKEPNEFTACMEVDICNQQAYVPVSPYQMGTTGTTAAHWIGVGGETAQAGLSSQPASVAIAVVSTAARNAVAGTGSLFGKGLVFQADALAGCDGVSGSAVAIEMARGHRMNWLTPTNGYAAHIRSDNTDTSKATGVVFANGGLTVRGLKADLVTEQNIFAVTTNNSAVNYLQVEPASTGQPVVLRAQGTDANIDLELFPKGTGVLRLGYNVSNAAVPANFAAQQMLQFKDATGTTYYIPCRAGTW